jgi:hypothetical protein
MIVHGRRPADLAYSTLRHRDGRRIKFREGKTFMERLFNAAEFHNYTLIDHHTSAQVLKIMQDLYGPGPHDPGYCRAMREQSRKSKEKERHLWIVR